MRVATFQDFELEDLELEINNFLEDMETENSSFKVIDLKYSKAVVMKEDDDIIWYSAVLMYEI